MADDSLLSSEELEFIQRLMASNGQSPTHGAPSFSVDGGPQANDLLMRLASHGGLSMHAHFGPYYLTFPLQFEQDEFHNLRMTLSVPVIYEDGPVVRAWRLHLDQPLPLLGKDGSPSPLSVQELSPSGLVVTTSQRRRPPASFDLRLALPDGEAMPVKAHRVREVDGNMSAYEVDFADHGDAERVRRFLFRQHRRLHPELNAVSRGNLL